MTDETRGKEEGDERTDAPAPETASPPGKKPRSKLKIALIGLGTLLLILGVVIFMPEIQHLITRGKLEVARQQRLIREKRERGELLEQLKNEKNSIERLRQVLAAEIDLGYKPQEVDLDKYGDELRIEYRKVIELKQAYEKQRLLREKSAFREIIKLSEQELEQLQQNTEHLENPDFNDWVKARKAVVELQPLVELEYSSAETGERELARQAVLLEFQKKLAGEGLNSAQYLALQRNYPEQVADYLKGER